MSKRSILLAKIFRKNLCKTGFCSRYHLIYEYIKSAVRSSEDAVPEGQRDCILDIYFLTVYPQAPEHLPKTDTALQTDRGQCQSSALSDDDGSNVWDRKRVQDLPGGMISVVNFDLLSITVF